MRFSVQPSFSHKLPGRVWHLSADPHSGWILLEIRDHSNAKVTYQQVNVQAKKIGKEREVKQLAGSASLIRYLHPYAVLEHYHSMKDPEAKDLLVYHWDKKQLKRLPDAQFDRVDGMKMVWHSVKTGERGVESLSASTTNAVDLEYPGYHGQGSIVVKLVEEIVGGLAQELGCEYLELGNCIIICYYLRLDGKYARKLLVIVAEEEVFHELLDEGLNGYAAGGFLVLGDYVVCIKNGNEILGIKVR